MATRTIATGVGTYLGEDGIWRFGMLGESVEVAESDLDRFDRLNGSGVPAVVEVGGVEHTEETDGEQDADGEQEDAPPAETDEPSPKSPRSRGTK